MRPKIRAAYELIDKFGRVILVEYDFVGIEAKARTGILNARQMGHQGRGLRRNHILRKLGHGISLLSGG